MFITCNFRFVYHFVVIWVFPTICYWDLPPKSLIKIFLISYRGYTLSLLLNIFRCNSQMFFVNSLMYALYSIEPHFCIFETLHVFQSLFCVYFMSLFMLFKSSICWHVSYIFYHYFPLWNHIVRWKHKFSAFRDSVIISIKILFY